MLNHFHIDPSSRVQLSLRTAEFPHRAATTQLGRLKLKEEVNALSLISQKVTSLQTNYPLGIFFICGDLLCLHPFPPPNPKRQHVKQLSWSPCNWELQDSEDLPEEGPLTLSQLKHRPRRSSCFRMYLMLL